MDKVQGIEDFVSQLESAVRRKLEAPPRTSDHWVAGFLNDRHHGVLGPDEFGLNASIYLFSGTRSWPLSIIDKTVEGSFQVGFGAIRQLKPQNAQVSRGASEKEISLLAYYVHLAHAPSLLLLGEPRGYLRLDYDSERGYGETRVYVTDSEFTSFNRLMYQTHGLRNDDAPDPFKLPGEDPPRPKFPENTPIELAKGIEEITTCLKAALKPFSQYETAGSKVLVAKR